MYRGSNYQAINMKWERDQLLRGKVPISSLKQRSKSNYLPRMIRLRVETNNALSKLIPMNYKV
jgi:hypothetical protein